MAAPRILFFWSLEYPAGALACLHSCIREFKQESATFLPASMRERLQYFFYFFAGHDGNAAGLGHGSTVPTPRAGIAVRYDSFGVRSVGRLSSRDDQGNVNARCVPGLRPQRRDAHALRHVARWNNE